MAKKTQRVDAFVDESIRGQTYYLCAVLVPFDQQSQLRKLLRKMALSSNQPRLHFHNESKKKKSEVLEAIGLNIEVIIARSQIRHDVKEEAARQKCLVKLIPSLQDNGVRRVTIERRSSNREDELTILRVRSGGPTIDFVHLDPRDEALLWCADAIVWAYGAGELWRSMVSTFVTKEIHVL